ncbi:MAG TPA: deoxyhypusine synthase [Candidatus Nanoarchaeia archaeon]|nr:deoxyhypusine synthase [Candidatus Nanoarchaeia archaeon]
MWIWDKHDKVEQKMKNYMEMERFPVIQGYNFEDKFDFQKFVESYKNMGFQGSNFGIAVSIMEEMLEKRKKGMKIFMSFTANMISSGNREIIAFLAKHKIIDGITTTAGALEEDVIKCMKPFHLGSFDVKGKILLDECVGRIGNIFVPADRYTYFERFMNVLFEKIKDKGILSTHEVAREMGLLVQSHEATKHHAESSFLYWCAKNSISVFCPGITDGTIGDIATFFRQKNPNFAIDMVKDNEVLTKMMMNSEMAGSIILGGGIAKHFLLNAAIFRDGFDYSIYITTATEFDGSDSGGNQEEAITWAKIKPDAKRVKVVADASLLFPLLVAAVREKIDTGK